MSFDVERPQPQFSRNTTARSQCESFLSSNTRGNTFAGNSYLQTYRVDEEGDDEHLGNSSTSATAMSIISIMIGAGVLILPQQFIKLGTPLGCLMLAVTCWTSTYVCTTLNEAIGRVQDRTGEKIHTLDDLALACFGTIGKRIAQFVLRASVIGKVSCYIVLIGRSLEYIMSPPSYKGWVVLSSGVFMLTAFVKSVKLLEKVSIVGMVCKAVYALPVFVGSLMAHFEADISPASDLWRLGGAYGFSVPVEQLLPSFGLFLFGFGPIEVIATVRRNLANQQRMPAAIAAAHIITGLFYVSVGAVGAWGFGDDVSGNITESMQSNGSKWATGYCLAAAVAMNLLVTIPISLYCFFAAVTKNRKLSSAADSVLRSSVMILCACIGLFVPYFMQVLQIFSSTFKVLLTVFVPLACGVKSARDSGKPYCLGRVLLDLVLVVLGLGCFVLGLTDAIDDLIREMAKDSEAAQLM
eukprot:CAMPEP_0170340002 /NCGR_PEP_ID=MMETSP0116_2-20130129/71083_1 /TAXON_ID=400756 /ORGANISM="Durinskia baltica, Strain CSIRO CS-38" /LENGTH=466 /DNA_ID=CAMNT_0010593469 /DNA_START=12 /DNA_END=1412 /DNA_ORIENTATION=-